MRFALFSVIAGLLLQAPILAAANTRSFPVGFRSVSKPKVILRADGIIGQTRTLRRQEDGSNVKLVSFVSDPFKTRLSIKPVDKSGSAAKVFAANSCSNALIVTNGTFYIRDTTGTRPLGLVRIDGITLSPPSTRTSGGFLAINDGKPRVFPRQAKAEALRAANAIESAPIVEENGTNGIHSDDGIRFDRIGIGLTETGETLIIAVFGNDQNGVSLFEFEQMAAWVTDQNSLRIKDFIAMDGGPSAHIYLPKTLDLLGDRGFVYIPNVVCLTRR